MLRGNPDHMERSHVGVLTTSSAETANSQLPHLQMILSPGCSVSHSDGVFPAKAPEIMEQR